MFLQYDATLIYGALLVNETHVYALFSVYSSCHFVLFMFIRKKTVYTLNYRLYAFYSSILKSCKLSLELPEYVLLALMLNFCPLLTENKCIISP